MRRLGVGIESPFTLVFGHLVRGRMFRLCECLHLELVGQFQRSVVERYIVLENLGSRRLLEDRLPRAFRLARSAVDTFVGVNIEHVGEALLVLTHILVDAIDRADADASGVNAVYAQSGYGPGHVRSTSLIALRRLSQTITAPGQAEKPPRPPSWSSLGVLRLGASSIAYIDSRQDKGVQRPGAPRQRMKEQRDGS